MRKYKQKTCINLKKIKFLYVLFDAPYTYENPKVKGANMSQTKIKYCRNCRWAVYGWCTIFQHDVKPIAGKCSAFITKRKSNAHKKEKNSEERLDTPTC